MFVLLNLCVCVQEAVYSLQCPVCETKRVRVYVCLGFSIVGGLSPGAGFFPPVQCFVGGVLAGFSSNKEPVLPA